MLAMSANRRIASSYGSPRGAATTRDVLSALRDSGAVALAAGPSLEAQREIEAPPRVEAATPVEGATMDVRAVAGDPTVGIAAFLDGVQRSQVRAHLLGVPAVHGAVAAAVRHRTLRRLSAWSAPVRSHALYLPRAVLDVSLYEALAARCAVVDTLAEHDPAQPLPRHPGDLAARALTAVQRERERAELSLATQWVRERREPLLIDGGIAGSEEVARSPSVVGVVKSHRTLYVAGDAMPAVLGLREGARSTAVALGSPRRTPVATWYLRLRDPGPRGPFFGLVRVEVALDGDLPITERADLVSRWLLAERAPVALPDARWDVMVYGIRECEQYLTSILQ